MQDAVVNKIKSKIAHGKLGEVSFPQYDVEYVTKLLAISQLVCLSRLKSPHSTIMSGARSWGLSFMCRPIICRMKKEILTLK